MSTAAKFSVNLFGSHPDLENDDCHTGDDFTDLVSAIEAAQNWREHFNAALPGYYGNAEVAYVEISGEDESGPFYQLIRNTAHKAKRATGRDEWAHEQAMQAGMAFGCAGYNDAMGWGSGEEVL